MQESYFVRGEIFGEFIFLKFPSFETAKTFCKLCSSHFICKLHVEWTNQTTDFIGREFQTYIIWEDGDEK